MSRGFYIMMPTALFVHIERRIVGVEVLGIQVILRDTEGIAEITKSNNCRLSLVTYGLASLFTYIIHKNSGNFK